MLPVFLLAALPLVAARPVVIVCADGLSARAVDASPGFQGVLRNASYTLRARTTEHTRSVEGWQAAMLGGWDPDPGTDVPSLFAHVRAQRAHARLWFLGWYRALRESAGDAVADWRVISMDEPRLVRDFAARAAQEGAPDLAVVFFDSPDAAGHRDGWESAAYRAAVERVAQHVRALHAAVPAALVYVISDHGGRGTTHAYYRENLDAPDMRDVPWIRYGDAHPRVLCDRVRTDETAADVAGVMGIEPHPAWRTRTAPVLGGNCTRAPRRLQGDARAASPSYILLLFVISLNAQ